MSAPVPPRRALLVVNPRSRRGADAAEQVEALLRGAGLEVERQGCADACGLVPLVEAACGRVDCVVLGGGDGTLNAAAPALIRTGLPLGILPLGTANDLARTLGIPADPAQAAAIIAGGHRRRVDLGEVNGHPFFNVASVGFGVDLTRALTRDAKRRWGKLGYAVAALRVLRRLRPFSVEIHGGGPVYRSRTIHLAVGNGRHYGGGMTVSEDARIDDGRLDIYSLEVASLWRLLLLLPAMRRGTLGRWAEVHTAAGQEITLHTRRQRSINTDGEITTHTPARFRVLPGAVSIYVSAPA